MTQSISNESVDAWVKGTTLTATANGTPAGVVACFTGVNNSNPNASGEDVYNRPENLPVAIASILSRNRSTSRFDPQQLSPEELTDKFLRFVNDCDRTPFLRLERAETGRIKYQNDYNRLIDDAVSLIQAAPDRNAAIKKSLVRLAGSKFTSRRQFEQWTNLFAMILINCNAGDCKITILYGNATMYADNDHPQMRPVTIDVRIAEYSVSSDMIRQYAKPLAQLPTKDIATWIEENSSPKGDGQLCFTPSV